MTNVLLITTDQQRADTLGCNGNPVCRTPRLDELAAAGTRYTSARTQNPYCQPSRASILLGEMPSRHGVSSNGIDLPHDAAARSVAAQFASAGHATALFGKAHFASTYPVMPTGRVESVEGSARVPADWDGPYFGFDHVQLLLFGHMLRVAPLMGRWPWTYGPPPFGLHYARWLFRDGFDEGVRRLDLMQPEAAGAAWDHTQTWASALPEEHHPTTWVTDTAIEWLGQRGGADEPFFAWVSYADPHHPMDPPAPWSSMYAPADVAEVLPTAHPEEFDAKPPIHRLWSEGVRHGEYGWANPGGASLTRQELATMTAGYYGMVSMLDHHIGRVLDALDTLGLADDTVVMVTTDHGELLGDHQMIFKGPLHYEGLLRVPLLVRGPGFAPGAVVDEPVGTVDLAATALAAAGLERPDTMTGRPLPGGPGAEGAPRREWVLTENDHQMVFRMPLRTVTTDRWKLTRYEEQPGVGELYDLVDDPGEVVNRWDDPACAATRAELLTLLDDVMEHHPRIEPVVGLVA